MAENIRLVVWDLDETFWQGTVTEGGHHYNRTNHDAVIELARRGIVSSICSKNNFATIKAILEAEGIWNYFVFPSIDWQPKGSRLAQLVEDVQLRAATVLFIDDNPMNRNEALHVVPDIQVEDENFIPEMLNDPRLKGKDDWGLTRLNQYKLLEKRHVDKTAHSDNRDFLAASGIKVTIDFDVDSNIDRAVELINRTNQLNFTKLRLPEDPVAARAKLRKELREPNTQAGLIHVRDNYGDHGLIGFYLMHVHSWQLIHFCFSCRTLGMEVERWVYEKLNRPAMRIMGEVLTDLRAAARPIDWINQENDADADADKPSLGRVFVRGGCEMRAIAHYFALGADELVEEANFTRGGLPIPIHHSIFMRSAIEGLGADDLAVAASLGYELSDFQSAGAERDKPFDLYLFSFWADGMYSLYGRKDGTMPLPFGVNGLDNGRDLRKASDDQLRDVLSDPEAAARLAALRDRFDYLGTTPGIQSPSGDNLHVESLQAIFAAMPRESAIFVLLGCERRYDPSGMTEPVPYMMRLNDLTRQAAEGRPNVHLLAPDDFILSPSDFIDVTHFNRTVYFRVYQRVVELLQASGQMVSAKRDRPPPRLVVSEPPVIQPTAPAKKFNTIFMRGGAESRNMDPFVRAEANQIYGEYVTSRDGIPVRVDHSLILRYALNGIPDEAIERLKPLGYRREDFTSYLAGENDADFYVFVFNQDANHGLWQLKGMDIRVPFEVPGADNARDLRTTLADYEFTNPALEAAFGYLCENFDYVGGFDLTVFRATIELIFSKIAPEKPIFILLPVETWKSSAGEDVVGWHWKKYNNAVAEICQDWPNVILLNAGDFVQSPAENIDGYHFVRDVYYRIYEWISAKAEALLSAPSRATVKERIGN